MYLNLSSYLVHVVLLAQIKIVKGLSGIIQGTEEKSLEPVYARGLNVTLHRPLWNCMVMYWRKSTSWPGTSTTS